MKRFSLFLILALLSLLPLQAASTKLQHKWLRIGILTNPGEIKIGEDFDLKVQAILKSETGFAAERIKVFLGDRVISEASDFSIEKVDNPDKPNLARISFDKSALVVNNEEELKLKLVLTESATNANSLTARFKKLQLLGDKKLLALDDFSFAPKLIKLRTRVIDAKSGSQIPAKVAHTPIRFKLSFEHDPKYIPAEDLESFKASKSILLRNLRVYRFTVDGLKEDITEEFKFDLVKDSSNKFAEFDTMLTHFHSQEFTIKDFEVYRFSIDTRHFFEEKVQDYPKNAKLNDSSIISFKAKKSEITDLSLNNNEIVMSYDPDMDRGVYLSEELFLNANYDKEKFKVKEIRSFKTNLNDYKNFALKPIQKSAFSLNSGRNVKFSILQDFDSIVLKDGIHKLPFYIKLKKRRNFFLKNKEFSDYTVIKKLNIDFALVFKSDNGLDYLIRDELDKNISLKFIDSPKFRKAEKASAELVNAGDSKFIDLRFKYSNTVDKETDPLYLKISLLNAASEPIPSASCSFDNFSNLSISAKASFSKKLDTKNCNAKFLESMITAAKLELSLERDPSYVQNLKLDPQQYPKLLEKDGLILDIKKD